MNKINVNYLYLFFFSLITILFRLYNLNFEDFWIDEIISFYVADPSITFSEFFLRHKTLENSPFLFNLILRLYFEIFGYKVEIARFLPAIFNILSIFIIIRLFVKITKAKSYILIFTLLAFNIYLIKYYLSP